MASMFEFQHSLGNVGLRVFRQSSGFEYMLCFLESYASHYNVACWYMLELLVLKSAPPENDRRMLRVSAYSTAREFRKLPQYHQGRTSYNAVDV